MALLGVKCGRKGGKDAPLRKGNGQQKQCDESHENDETKERKRDAGKRKARGEEGVAGATKPRTKPRE